MSNDFSKKNNAMHLYRVGYIFSPALKQYSSKADKNEDKTKSNTKNCCKYEIRQNVMKMLHGV